MHNDCTPFKLHMPSLFKQSIPFYALIYVSYRCLYSLKLSIIWFIAVSMYLKGVLFMRI